ncbi:alpha/beta hydrolase [Actinoalloteichus hymeniacidonis]|uniref:Alpha/beta hydrolase family protein n=1 Tax=Actinoalloteichus hymeniacidonis TaxID=340345 RepID=A0AAC9HUH3_9PSEU|nr:alpha/beta fold hydrolase [Actinoalloteichus hymeniacidonis]AOS65952.1 Alpha/beta hydrolase family protein [Actinoalloteichus hymeniacidonis]MBB5905952.1 pimeloyl-ACP methyl ester carboxylesterase [Actinoalloteichus hymeniacidonis]
MTTVDRVLIAEITARTADDVQLRGVFLPRQTGPSAVRRRAATNDELAIVVGHGFTNHVRKPALQRALSRLARRAAVFAFDFRGHGRSGGRSTVGDREVLDVAAGVEYARRCGYRRVATLGFSMGASIMLRHAALAPGGERPEAVIAVSAPSRWWIRESSAMRRVHWLLEQPTGRLVAPLVGVRLDRAWEDVPVSPLEAAAHIAPTPLLLVHGELDDYFSTDHARQLHVAAGPRSELWIEPEIRHAETAMTPELIDRMAQWLDRNAYQATRQRQLIKAVIER